MENLLNEEIAVFIYYVRLMINIKKHKSSTILIYKFIKNEEMKYQLIIYFFGKEIEMSRVLLV